nr:sigma-70 family RNA polymerase sigma factor [Chloroflexota bacterium]
EYGHRLGLDLTQSEDVAQEAFARLLRLRLGQRPDHPPGWLFRVVRNLAVDSHRRQRRVVVRDIGPASSEASTPDASERVWVWDAVDRLPERQREAVYLRYRAGLDYATIATILGITESGARANAFKGIEALREAMEERP